MAVFSTVDWSTLSQISSAKMQAMMDNDQYLKDKLDSGGVLDYTSRTTSVTGITSSTYTDNVALTLTVTTLASRLIQCSVNFLGVTSTGGDSVSAIGILEDTVVKSEKVINTVSGLGYNDGGTLFSLTTPSAGSHTYALCARRISGTGTVTMEGSSTGVMYLLVTDIGPA